MARTSLCVAGRHRDCGGEVNRGTSSAPRLVGCTCACHRRESARSSSKAPMSGTVRRWAKDRDGHRCRARVEGVCVGTPDHVHHVRQRSVGGDDELGNLLTVCWRCHGWIHDHPAEAEALGLLARSTPAEPNGGDSRPGEG